MATEADLNFYEEDEPLEDILRAWNEGVPTVTDVRTWARTDYLFAPFAALRDVICSSGQAPTRAATA